MKRFISLFIAAVLFTFISCNFGVDTYRVVVAETNYSTFSSASGITISDGYYISSPQSSSFLDALPNCVVSLTKEGIIDALVGTLKLSYTDAKVECNNLIRGKYGVFSRRGSTLYLMGS